MHVWMSCGKSIWFKITFPHAVISAHIRNKENISNSRRKLNLVRAYYFGAANEFYIISRWLAASPWDDLKVRSLDSKG